MDSLTDSQAMAEKIKAYIQGKRDDREIGLLKNKPQKRGTKKGMINTRLISVIESDINDESVREKLEAIIKTKKKKDESILLFERDRYQKLVQLASGMAQDIVNDYRSQLEKINDEYDIITWLDEKSKKAEGVNLATHVIKLTHSSIYRASNIRDESKVINLKYLSTSSLDKPYIDGAYDNAADSPIASLLKLEHNGSTLADYILQNNAEPLAEFSNNNKQIQDWLAGFKKAVEPTRKSSHYLAKQIYYPVSKNDYQLLLPVTSSSIAQLIFERLKNSSYIEQKEAINKRKKKLYSQDTITEIKNKSVVKVTASQHQSVSSLNNKRNGELALLSCTPPLWGTKIKPPLKLKNLFYDSQLRNSTREEIFKLRGFLLLLQEKSLSDKKPKLHAYWSNLVDGIIDLVFNYVANIQNLKHQTGWTAKSKLKMSHQLWLDPYRKEENFQQQRQQSDWQTEISNDFASWLNRQLEHKKMILSLAQKNTWEKIMRTRLREFEAYREV